MTANNIYNATATLSHNGEMTSFKYGEENIRFRTSAALQRYTSVKLWDKGYLVVTALYDGLGEIEEYIDLQPILRNLYIVPDKFLKEIKDVSINYD